MCEAGRGRLGLGRSAGEHAGIVARLGPQAAAWRALARGALPHTFQPIEPEFALKEFYYFETPVEQLDSLLFIGARMIDCLVARAVGRALGVSDNSVRRWCAVARTENGLAAVTLTHSDAAKLGWQTAPIFALRLEWAAWRISAEFLGSTTTATVRAMSLPVNRPKGLLRPSSV